VVVIYESERKMCALAKGIARGVARHYGERIELNELTCMLAGKPSCTIAVKLLPPP
jgi:predicted hydrocarbon binding protein